jgi:hypothetical protein
MVLIVRRTISPGSVKYEPGLFIGLLFEVAERPAGKVFEKIRVPG